MCFSQMEMHFLSNDGKEDRIMTFLGQIRDGLNDCGACSIPMGES